MSSEPVFVVAGGWSASQAPLKHLHRWGHVIGVNDAAIFMEVHTAVTMDRLWLENRLATLEERMIPCWYRANTAKNVSPGPVHVGFANNNRPGRMSENVRTLDGDNSGACALNLAYHMRPPAIYLIGYDMQKGPAGEAHWYPDYPWNPKASKPGKLAEWAGSFAAAAKQFERAGISVVNVSTRTAVRDFPIITPRDMLLEFA